VYSAPAATERISSDLVTYQPPFTGGVATIVQDKLAETISVIDFGAVGDGIADDSHAFTLAVSYAASLNNPKKACKIVFPPGKVYLGEFIVPNVAGNALENFWIDFSGATLKGKAGSSVVLLLNGGSNHQKVTGSVIDMTDMANLATTYGMSFKSTYGLQVSNVTCIDPPGGSNPYGVNIEGVNGVGGVYTSLFNTVKSNRWRLVGPDFVGLSYITTITMLNCDAQQYVLRYATSINIIGGAIQWFGGFVRSMIDMDNVRGLLIQGVDIESNVNAIYLASVSNVTNITSRDNDMVNFNGTLTNGVNPVQLELADYYSPFGDPALYRRRLTRDYKYEYNVPLNGFVIKSIAGNPNTLDLGTTDSAGVGAATRLRMSQGATPSNARSFHSLNDSGTINLVDDLDTSKIEFNSNGAVYLPSSASETTIDRTAQAPGYTRLNKFNGVSGDEFIPFSRNGVTIGSITQSGTTGVAYNNTSDYRLKENIHPMQNALGLIAQLNPVTYTWKSDGSAGQGFIAHELQAVVPDCVTGKKDAVDADGKPVYQGIDTSFLVATLTKAIQELKAEFDAYKASHP
jgi:hypothetical protein